ncbi:MAG: methylaspartate mutase subunit S [Rhizobiales bacterium]|nr:methylaspartate mutase subunit S [Hyphomicrobiales bacterium]
MADAQSKSQAGTAAALERPRRQPVIVLGTIGHDAHIVGSSVLRFALEEAGFMVVFLGAIVPPEEFITAAKESAADAILVSSMYGMGRIDCADFGDKCAEAGLGHVKLYLGGILVTDPEQWDETEALFKGYGFHRVYPPQTKPETAIADLKKDLGFAG